MPDEHLTADVLEKLILAYGSSWLGTPYEGLWQEARTVLDQHRASQAIWQDMLKSKKSPMFTMK